MGSAGSVHLPEDVLFEILMRLPVRSLLRFKSVCKSWYALIKSSDFIYRHANMMGRHSKSKLGTFICQYHASDQFFVILSFDFNKETFRKLLAPAGGDTPSSRLSQLCSIGDKPACTKSSRAALFFEVWVLNDYNTKEECWTKLYSFGLSRCSSGPFAFTGKGEFGFLFATEGLKLYNFAKDGIEDRSFGHVCNVDLYEESLVSIYAVEQSPLSMQQKGIKEVLDY